MRDAQTLLDEALHTVRVVDPHCHLRPEKPSADSLADIVLYHHVWIELVSAGLPQCEVTTSGLPHELAEPGMAPLERVRRAVGHLGHVKSTTSGLLLRWILNDLYGIEELCEDNLAQADQVVRSRAGDSGWAAQVLRERCGIQASISVAPGGTATSNGILRGYEALVTNLADGKRSPAVVLAALEESFGRTIDSARDYREFLAAVVEKAVRAGCRFIGLWPVPYLPDEPPGDGEVSRTIERTRRGESLSRAEVGGFCHYAMAALLEEIRRTDLSAVQLIVGAEVLPPHRSITQWSEHFCGALARMASAHPGVHFNLSAASDLFTQDLGILAKHLPNVSVAGYWWHTFYPFYIKKSLATRLDMVPNNKIVGFFSDAYHCEWCYPKLKLLKQILREILVERMERGWYTVEMALDLISRLLYENPRAIYGL